VLSINGVHTLIDVVVIKCTPTDLVSQVALPHEVVAIIVAQAKDDL
jgi:hypothetical protein